MKIVFITPPRDYFTPAQSSAIATIFWHCCQEAQREGIYPYVVANTGGGPAYPWKNTILIDHPQLPSYGLSKLQARLERKFSGWTEIDGRASMQRIEKALRVSKLEQAYIVTINNPEGATYLRQKFPKAYLAHWFQNQVECRPWARQKYKDSVDASLAVSDFTARWVQDFYGLRPGTIQTIYNSVDAEQFRPAEAGHDHTSGLLRINFVGRTGHEKAPDTLLKAGLILAEKKVPFQLQFVGHHPADSLRGNDYSRELCDLTKQVEALGVPVEWTGYIGRQELPHYLQRAAINVVPSRWEEPFGMTILEGMACGLATVVTRVGGIPEVVGDAALLFERNDENALAEHLVTLLQNEQLRQEYSRRARERALLFPWKRTWTELYTAISKSEATKSAMMGSQL